MRDPEGYFGWIFGAIVTAFAALSSAVVALYRNQISDYKAAEVGLKEHVTVLEQRADKCEAEREQLRVNFAVLQARSDVLEERVTTLETHTIKPPCTYPPKDA